MGIWGNLLILGVHLHPVAPGAPPPCLRHWAQACAHLCHQHRHLLMLVAMVNLVKLGISGLVNVRFG